MMDVSGLFPTSMVTSLYLVLRHWLGTDMKLEKEKQNLNEKLLPSPDLLRGVETFNCDLQRRDIQLRWVFFPSPFRVL